MSESPWSADAKTGATGESYTIRTVNDFLKVPEERRYICLREFHAWLYMRRAVVDVLEAAGKTLSAAFNRSCIVDLNEVFVWHDDGKATMSVSITERSGERHKAEGTDPVERSGR